MSFTKNLIFVVIFFFCTALCCAEKELVSLFPIENYDQSISTWINPNSSNYDKLLMSDETTEKHLALFYNHTFGLASPWNIEYVTYILKQHSPDDIKSIEKDIIENFTNQDKPSEIIGYAENFRPYDKNWIDAIAKNINLSQFDFLKYQINNRGIAIDNLHVRVLPTEDVHFYSYKLAGQGYPFDNLQISSLWVGTPVYILGETKDHAWFLVLTPDYIGWVKSNGIARCDNAFVLSWSKAAKNKLAAITSTNIPILDDKKNFLFSAYIGSFFPAIEHSSKIQIMVPEKNLKNFAKIKKIILSPESAAVIPIPATPHNFAKILTTLINRPYGWGNMYFYNDCSAELKNLFTPFGIWLPRHSSDQISVGKITDVSDETQEKRLSYLLENGHPFMTIVYIGQHIVLYIGNFPNKAQSQMALTYQNLWGLSPHPAIRRSVIGKSVFFPLLLQFPEDASLASQASKKYFKVANLDQIPAPTLMKQKIIDLKALMFPEDT